MVDIGGKFCYTLGKFRNHLRDCTEDNLNANDFLHAECWTLSRFNEQ